MKRCEWVKPVLVAQVKFTEWTLDNQLRQPVFLALRTDKEAKNVVREKNKPVTKPSANALCTMHDRQNWEARQGKKSEELRL
jgi:ATP-dependent DNA ligase